jgi:hypothetical protein
MSRDKDYKTCGWDEAKITVAGPHLIYLPRPHVHLPRTPFCFSLSTAEAGPGGVSGSTEDGDSGADPSSPVRYVSSLIASLCEPYVLNKTISTCNYVLNTVVQISSTPKK